MIINFPNKIPTFLKDIAQFVCTKNSTFMLMIFGAIVFAIVMHCIGEKTGHAKLFGKGADSILFTALFLCGLASYAGAQLPTAKEVKAKTVILPYSDVKIDETDTPKMLIKNKQKKTIIKGEYLTPNKLKLTPVTETGKNILAMENYIKKHHLQNDIIKTNTFVNKKYVMVQYLSDNDVSVLVAQNGKVRQIFKE